MILYISKRFETNVAARVHRGFLEEKYGKENIFVIDMRPNKEERRDKYICFGKYKNKIKRIGRWIQGNTMYQSKKIINEICEIVRKYNIKFIFIEDSTFGNVVKEIKCRYPETEIVTFYHDIAVELYAEWAKKGGIVSKIENSIAIKQEKINQRYSDIDMVFNERDAKLYEKYYGNKPNAIIPIAMPTPIVAKKNIEKLSKEKKKVLFVGSKYYPNIIGIRWFYKEVLPQLGYDFELKIVGRGTEFLAEEFNDEQVKVVGTVDSVEPFYQDADIVIAPLFDGGGMKCKTVEAVGYGKYLVGTTESLQGFNDRMESDLLNKKIFCVDTAEEWIKVMNILLSKKYIEKFNEDVFEFFKENYSYEATKKIFMQILNSREK